MYKTLGFMWLLEVFCPASAFVSADGEVARNPQRFIHVSVSHNCNKTDMLFNWKSRKQVEKKEQEAQNLESYIANFTQEKRKYQYDPLTLELAGARYYKDDNLGFLFSVGDQVLLFHELNNVHDENAVKVENLRGQKIGYIPQDYSKEIREDLENGFYYKVTIESIINDLLRPYILLSLIRHSDTEEQKITEEELQKFREQREEKKIQSEVNSEIAFELSQKGLKYESDGYLDNAIELYEQSIKYREVPPISFKRLLIYYRKEKDYDNEIRVINRWLETYNESPANIEIIEYKTAEIKKRLDTVFKLKNKKI